MDVKTALGVLAIFFEIASMALYYLDIWRGNTKPHLYTMLVWSIMCSVAFIGTLVAGGGAGAWGTGVAAISNLTLVPIAYWWGTKDITRSDKIFLTAALSTIVVWILTKDPFWSLALTAVIDAIAMAPTIRKTWHAPESESLGSWLLSEARSLSQIGALGVYSPTTLIYQLEILTIDAILLVVILSRRVVIRNAAVLVNEAPR